MVQIASRQSLVLSEVNAVNSREPFRRSTWNQDHTNERQSRDSNRSATSAGPKRTKICVFGGEIWLQTNASDSNRRDNSR